MGKIRRKQSSTQKEWLEAILGLNINEERVKRLTDNAVEKLIRSPYKKSGYGWSGGKDGLVLQKICELAGIKRAVLFITSLEFKDYLDFVEEYKPLYVEVVKTKHDLEWLKNNPNRLFPETSKERGKYFIEVQRNGLKKYFKDNKLDQVVTGHRNHDGNHCPNDLTINNDGYVQNNIIKDWTHEDVLSFLFYNNIALPKIYYYDYGFIDGTGCYPSITRKGRTIEQMWGYVYKYDEGAVNDASLYIESAKEFLRRKNEYRNNENK